MDYKVMKRPMFKMGGPTSGGTGITSGLETPRQNFAYSTYGEAVQAIPGAFEKRRTGLENQMGAIGPMAALQAISGGALENVDSFSDLPQVFGNPAVLQSVMGGLSVKNKLQSSLDDVDLKEATTMATLLKPKGTGDNQAVYDKKVKKLNYLQGEIKKLNVEAGALSADSEEFRNNRELVKTYETEIKTTISSSYETDADIIKQIESDYYRANNSYPSSGYVTRALKKIKEGRAVLYSGFQETENNAEGGRVGRAMGGGFDMGQEQVMPATQTTAPGPEMMPQGGGQDMGEDPFTILRQRLPQEISDEVVSLIAYNKIAFQDFANIQDQDDVDLFNQKYNVQLVVDMASR